MTEQNAAVYCVNTAPHIHSGESTQRIMWTVFFCLIPSGIVSMYVFGPTALWIMLTAVLAAVVTEAGSCRILKRPSTIADGSACVTGLLLAYNVPPQAPLWMVFLGTMVAIVFGKMVFGGLGFNIFNPALIGRVFLMVSFPVLMTRWPKPFTVDVVTGPTPLAVFKDSFAQTGLFAPADILAHTYRDLFLGFRGGCVGEASVVALLIGAGILLARRYITWHTPVSFIATVAVMTWIFGGRSLFQGDWLLHVLSGGLVLGAFYMATDYVSGPITSRGRLIFGAGCGIITSIIRLWGGYPEGVSFAILLMNAAAPLIDRYSLPRRFGATR